LRKRTDEEALSEFITDESGIFEAEGVAAVYYPQSEAELVEALTEANEQGILVTTSGQGTGITGGRVAVYGGVVVTTQDICAAAPRDLPRVEAEQFGTRFAIYVDEENLQAYCPAGMSLELLDSILPDGLIYPPDPTEKTALLGSTIATNASGAGTFHYGPTRDWVLGLRVVLPNGDVVAVQRGQVRAQQGVLSFTGESGSEYTVHVPTYQMPDVKNAAGLYARPGMDLVDLFVGSEGILGIVSEAHIKLAPRPDDLIGQIAFFTSEEDALGFVDDLRKAADKEEMRVLSIEYFDRNALEFMEHDLVQGKSYSGVYTQVAGSLDELEPLLVALEEHECAEDWFAETPKDEQEQKEFRHLLPEGVNSYLRRHGSQKLGTDMVVPADRFAEMLEGYRAAGEALAQRFPREGKHYLMFGHIGNYHLHVNFITHNPEELGYAKELYSGLAQQAVEAGGTISGEHGVGKKTLVSQGRTIPYLEVMYGKDGLMQIARAKKALDPNLVLNVGNVVPREYLEQV